MPAASTGGARGRIRMLLPLAVAPAVALLAACGPGATSANIPPVPPSSAASSSSSSAAGVSPPANPEAAAGGAPAAAAQAGQAPGDAPAAAAAATIPKTGAADLPEGAALALVGAGLVTFGWRRLRDARR